MAIFTIKSLKKGSKTEAAARPHFELAHRIFYTDEWDSYYCKTCDIWLEEECKCKELEEECQFSGRPERPSNG